MIIQHNPAFLQIPPESLFFSDSESPQPPQLPSLPFLFDFLFPSLRCLPVPARGGFHLPDSRSSVASGVSRLNHTSFSFPFVTAVHEASEVVSSLSCIFLEDSEHTSSISHVMEGEHDSTDIMSRASFQCFIALQPSQSLQDYRSFPSAFPLDERMLLLHVFP